MDIIAHTMEYSGGLVESFTEFEQYTDNYYEEYKRIYDDY